MHRSTAAIWVIAALVGAIRLDAQDVGIRAPDGFQVELYAGDDLAHDIFSMTIDSHGRVVVAGKDYVKTLHDDDGDGRADRATLFSRLPQSGAHGLVFDGPDLICTGDNSVLRLRDTDGDGQADGPPERWAALKNPEHGANGLLRGPDGWFYLICGNDAGVSADLADSKYSPVRRPECGAVVRFSPDGGRSEIVAHGFRNPYDADFNAAGHLFVVDSDGERDQYLPWYSPTRLFDVAWGQHHGWVLRGWQHSWNRPAYLFDSGIRLAEIGRGSPTGVVVYRHRQFPPAYRNGVFSCCWTLGRVYHFPLRQEGSSYTTETEIFLETTGEVGFAPVDLAVGPAGDLFIAIGGRQTRGSVFRVSFVGTAKDPVNLETQADPTASPIDRVLHADQPLAAWSRASWLPIAQQLGRPAFVAAALDAARDDADRLRSLEVLADAWDGVSLDVIESLDAQRQPAVTARAVALLSRSASASRSVEVLSRMLESARDPRVRRAAWETLGRCTVDAPLDEATVRQAEAETTDRRVRTAALWATRQADRHSLDTPRSMAGRLGRRRVELMAEDPASPSTEWLMALAAGIAGDLPVELRLEAVRVAQLELGDVRTEPTEPPVYAGYAARRPEAIADDEVRANWGARLADEFPTGQRQVDYELARLLGMLQPASDALLVRFPRVWSESSRLEDDLHYLIVLSRLAGTRDSQTSGATAKALVCLQGKLNAGPYYASRNWPARVGELFQELCRRDPSFEQRVVDAADFGAPQHSSLVLLMNGNQRLAGARKLAQQASQADDDAAWTSELVEAIGTLPSDESLPILRLQWQNFAVRDAIAQVLARHGQATDRGRLVEALGSVQSTVVERAAQSLALLNDVGGPADLVAAVQALRSASLAKEQAPARRTLHDLLSVWTKSQLEWPGENAEPTAALDLWLDWLRRQRPELVERAQGEAGIDVASWRQRLEAVDWSLGNVDRGKTSFEKRACARCHRAADRLGPDLAGAAGRLSLQDLFTSIVDPNKDVAPLYQTTQVVTRAGKVYQGLIVYESPESTLVQTTPDDTVRITGQEIVAMRKSRQSLMPAGILNKADDQELADLYAYLKTLRGGR